MAKDQRRNLNLTWSAKRWKAEHDRLSRAGALMRLAAEKVNYDVSRYETLLPKSFPGYLIRTSRRLGMEGLRQRHCVASYHHEVLAGRCAIASVFAAGQRWTVQLIASNDPQRPLRIAQIKTRLNDLPSAAVRDEIHAVLGVRNDHAVGPAPGHDDGDRNYMAQLRQLLPVLRQHRVTRVQVYFDGGGDSGSIASIDYDAPDDFDAHAAEAVHEAANPQFENGSWVRQRAPVRGTVHDAIEELTYDYLEETGVDWYNDDGGFGELVIDAVAETVSLEVSVRYTESNTEFTSERCIPTGEEL
jgi:hypothetical protein